MTQRNNHPQALQATSPDVLKSLLLPTLPIAAPALASILLVLVLITVQTGAGIGFA